MHLGEKGKTAAKVEYWMSNPVMVDCPICGRTYDYSDAMPSSGCRVLIRGSSARYSDGTPTWGETMHCDGPPGPEEESRERVDSAKNRASAPSRLRFACVAQQTARFEFHWFCRLKLPTDTLLTYRAIRKPRQAALTDHLVQCKEVIRLFGNSVLRF